MVARLRLGNKLDKRRGEFTKTAAAQAFYVLHAKRAHARVVKPIFTLARQYPDCRL
jgi:hypothetical protein